MSYFLRHNPWEIELEPDEAGWVPVSHLLEGLKPSFPKVTVADLEQMNTTSDKTRFEIKGDKIRATYGHSLPKKIKKEPASPPTLLYHGTATTAVKEIMEVGLKPMNRQYVHLALEPSSAKVVGKRKSKNVAIIVVDAGRAAEVGVVFYEELKGVWLSDHIPPGFLLPMF
jgi:putative RNA 2'-phosphotransferase